MTDRLDEIVAEALEVFREGGFDDSDLSEAQVMAACRAAYMAGHEDGVLAREDART